MSIAAANTFTRNIYKEWIKPDATPPQEAKVSKLVSLRGQGVRADLRATLDKQNAINFQLLGGIWILQTFPAIVFSLYTRWFHRWALLAGWAVGMVYGTVAAYNVINPVTGKHFGGSIANMPVIGQLGYIASDGLRDQRRRRGGRDPRPARGQGAPTRPTRPSADDYFIDRAETVA